MDRIIIYKGIRFVNGCSKSLVGRIRFFMMLKTISVLPLKLIYRLQKESIVIRFTSLEEIREISQNDLATGFYTMDKNKKVIYVGNCMTYKRTFYHELGHLVDNCVFQDKSGAYQSYESEENILFKSIYSNEKDYCTADYYKNHIAEYFAESFANFIANNNMLKKRAPKTFLIMQKCVNVL